MAAWVDKRVNTSVPAKGSIVLVLSRVVAVLVLVIESSGDERTDLRS